MDIFFNSYANCFRKYFVFSGRSARQEYVVFTIVNIVLSLILGLIPILGGIFGLIIIIPGLSVAVRRLHDLNKSGWWLFAPYLLIIIGFIILLSSSTGDNTGAIVLLSLGVLSAVVMSIWMLFFKGTAGHNRFGDEQKQYPPHNKNFTSVDNITVRLEQAKKMRDDGIVSESEYEEMRAKIVKDI